jgi:hypothetical protein
MDEKTHQLIKSSTAGFFTNLTYGALVLLAGWAFGYLLGVGLSRVVQSKALGAVLRYICPFVGLLAAGPLALKLFAAV